jgi:hypothetical protein
MVGSESGLNVSEWNDIPYLWTVVAVILHYKNPTKHVSLVQSDSEPTILCSYSLILYA